MDNHIGKILRLNPIFDGEDQFHFDGELIVLVEENRDDENRPYDCRVLINTTQYLLDGYIQPIERLIDEAEVITDELFRILYT